MELFRARGYVQTTVEEIAARAGLTERTFFRYFADKREVLFSGSDWLETLLVERIESASHEAHPLELVVSAFEAAAKALQELRDLEFVRAHHALLTKHAELRERELIKLASLALAVTKALRGRGVAEPTASLAAEAGIVIFKVAFERWLNQRKRLDFAAYVRDTSSALEAMTSRGAEAQSGR